MLTYNGKVVTSPAGKWPYHLPAYTLRIRTSFIQTPFANYGTFTRVGGAGSNLWDWTYESPVWENVFENKWWIKEVVAAGDTSGVTSTSRLFVNCTGMESVYPFDTSNVTDMSMMFAGCESMTTAPSIDTSKVTTMYGMFASCKALSSVPLYDTSNVTDMSEMFNQCYALTSVPQFDTTKVTNMKLMLHITPISSVPLFDTSNVTDMSMMLQSCVNLTELPLFDTSSATDVSNAFYECLSVETGALALYQQMSSQSSPPSTYTGCFTNCGLLTTTGAAELAQIPTSWGGTGE